MQRSRSRSAQGVYYRNIRIPQQADSIMKIQKELDETKIVLHKTIESVLERGAYIRYILFV